MWQYSLKIALSAVIIVTVAELAKRSSFWGATLASLPLTSILAFIWLYLDSKNTEQVAALSQDLFWLVLPSLTLLIALPLLLRSGFNFWLSLIISCLITAISYFCTVKLLYALSIRI